MIDPGGGIIMDNIKEILIQYGPYLVALLILIIGFIYTMVKKPEQIKKWLINACNVAEQALGSGTGQMKLHQVYSAFVAKYPLFSLFISFETFSKWVDGALDEIKEWAENNDKIANIFNIEISESEEVGDIEE